MSRSILDWISRFARNSLCNCGVGVVRRVAAAAAAAAAAVVVVVVPTSKRAAPAKWFCLVLLRLEGAGVVDSWHCTFAEHFQVLLVPPQDLR